MADTNLDGKIVGIEAEVDGVVFHTSSTKPAVKEQAKKAENANTQAPAEPEQKLLHRGPITVGITVKIPYDPVSKVYFTPAFNQSGELVEVFITISKQSPTNKVIVGALARSISTGLKYGVPVEKFIKHFKGQDAGQVVLVKFPGQEKPKFIKSMPDLIGHALEFYGSFENVRKLVQENNFNWFGGFDNVPDVVESTTGEISQNVVQETSSAADGPISFEIAPPVSIDPESICPECGAVMVNEAGCWTCPECHYSKCG